MSIAVIDAARDLVAFGRQDGAAQISIDLAMKKAFTAKSFNMPTDVVGSISTPGSPIYGIEGTDSRLVLFAGGSYYQVFPLRGLTSENFENLSLKSPWVDSIADWNKILKIWKN